MKIDRRHFIGFAVGGVAGTLLSPIPWKSTDDISIWTQNWPWIPRLKYGHVARAAGISKATGTGLPLSLCTVDGNPVVAYGQPANPVSGGRLTAIAAPEVQMRYSPSRVTKPLKKSGNGHTEMGWDEAMVMIAEALSKAEGKVVAISGDETGSVTEVLSALVSGLGSQDTCVMPGESQAALASWGAMGGSGTPGHDMENADHVLILGAEVFTSTPMAMSNARAFDEAKVNGAKSRRSYTFVGPVESRSASICDRYIPLAPGAEVEFCLSVAHVLVAKGHVSEQAKAAKDFNTFTKLVQAYAPADVTKRTGVQAHAIEMAADELASARRPLVLAGAMDGRGYSAAACTAAMGLNLLLGRINEAGGIFAAPDGPQVVQGAEPLADVLARDSVSMLQDVVNNPPAVLLVVDANPAYAMPDTDAVVAAMGKAGLSVAITPYMDETAAACDVVLPAAISLERYEDMSAPLGAPYGMYSATAPLLEPMGESRAPGDILIELAAALGKDLGVESMEKLVGAKANAYAKAGAYPASLLEPGKALIGVPKPAAMGRPLNHLTETGDALVLVDPPKQTLTLGTDMLSKEQEQASPAANGDVALVALRHLNIGSDRVALPPHNTVTLPLDIFDGTYMGVHMCHAMANTLGVAAGDVVQLKGAGASVTAKVAIDETVMPGVVAAPLGLGHTAWDEFSRGKGENLYRVIAARTEASSGLSVTTGCRVSVVKS